MMSVAHIGSPDIARVLGVWLRESGHTLVDAVDPDDLTTMVTHSGVGMIVISEESPRNLVTVLRRRGVTVGIVVLGHGMGDQTVADILAAGADDHMLIHGMGTRRAEFLARLGAVQRRSVGLASQVVELGNLRMNADSMRAVVGGWQVPLSPTEFRVLWTLVSRSGRVASQQQLGEAIWRMGEEKEEKGISVQICKVRKKLRMAECTARIETVWGCGWRAVAD